MENITTIAIWVIGLGLFFYFGYRHDYRRNPKGFWETLIAVPFITLTYLMGLLGLGRIFKSLWKKWRGEEEGKD